MKMIKIEKIEKPIIEKLFEDIIDNSILNVDCCEISLPTNTFCNLSEINCSTLEDQHDLLERVKAATIIGTLQGTYMNFHYLSTDWIESTKKEALLGISLTGLADVDYDKFNWTEAAQFSILINEEWAAKLGVNTASRICTIKPSGCFDLATKIKTSIGQIDFTKIFEINGYNISELETKENEFLPVTEKIFVKDENDEWKLISKLYVNGYKETYEIQFEDDLVINCTENHKFLTTTRGWVEARYLTEDDDIISY